MKRLPENKLANRVVIIGYRSLSKRCRKLVKNARYSVAVGIRHGAASLLAGEKFPKASRRIMFYRHGIINHPYARAYMYKSADVIVTISDGMAAELSRAFPQRKEKLMMRPNMIEYQRIRDLACQPAPQKPQGRLVFCSCGRISKKKGYDIAVKAARILKDKGVQFTWYFVCDGYYQGDIEKLIAENGLADGITITGMLIHSYPYIRMCDVYIHPSYVESFGNVIAEALVLYRPVVSAKTNGAFFRSKTEKTDY